MTFKLIDKVYQEYLRRNDNLFILFIDSDCILDRVCLQNFVYDMELSPGNRRDMLAMTGVITSTTKKHSLITLLQDMEYIHGQLFERTVESGCGAVTCLPGALTMLRFSAFRRMAKYYFADKAEQCEDLFDFAKGHLGEDRWLTHLFMIGAKKRYQIQMCTSAFCKTEAVQTMASLIKQRRRWFLGFITNEVCMLTDWRLWKKYPILVLVRFMQNTIRTTALLFFIMVLAIMSTSKTINDLPVGFIAISLGLNWLMMIYFGAKLRRYKIWLYPLMFILNPFFNWWYMVYGIFTAGQRTWGGPRADAAAADSTTTPQQAIEQAEKAGDDLNIVPESFIPAAEAQASGGVEPQGEAKRRKRASDSGDLGRSRSILQPPNKIAGKFSAPERTPSGWYQHPDDSMASVNVLRGSSSGYGRGGKLQHRDSFESAETGSYSVYMPRRVESIMGEEDRRKYELAHGASHVSTFVGGSRLYQGPPPGQVYEFSESEMRTAGFTDAADRPGYHRRLASNDSVHSGGSVDQQPQQQQQQHQHQHQARQPPVHPSSANPRTGRSPLGRASWVRTSTMNETEDQMEGRHDAGRK
jgi:chitin synthase